jgi:hypothetical protein
MTRGLHYFLIHAHARRKRDAAYVSCWTDFRLQEGALLLAKHYIRDAGWTVRSVQQHRRFSDVSVVQVDSRKYYREAERGGASFVFHTYVRSKTPTAKRKAAKERTR